MMKHLIPVFFCCLLCFSALCQESVSSLVKDIAADNKVESSQVGFAGSPSEQYKRGLRLSELATVPDLLRLARTHENGVVRIYAWYALLRKDAAEVSTHRTQVLDLEKQMRSDTTPVFTLSGCIGGTQTVAALSREVSTHYPGNIPIIKQFRRKNPIGSY